MDHIKIVGGQGLNVRGSQDLTLTACEIRDSHDRGLLVSGSSSILATNLRILQPQDACIEMSGRSTMTVTDCELIPGGQFPTGFNMYENSSLAGTRVRISQTYICFRMLGEPTLSLTDSTIGGCRESYLHDKASLLMTGCVLTDDLSASRQMSTSIEYRECSIPGHSF